MKTVLITGSNGQLGEACKLNLRSKFNLILSDRKILNKPTFIDITKKDSVKNAIDYHQPNVVLNLAAYTDVDGCEKSIETSENINLNGLKNICKYFNGHIIQISTDYVFDGMSGPYHEEDRTNPLSVYGKHKLAAEEFLYSNQKYAHMNGYHHMGGTRMGMSKNTSVVDKNLKVHDTKNLYINGSSVFVTAGNAYPTLTITQLSLRLANHIAQSIKS